MLTFLANNIEQLDVAREHILLGDANNSRFGLMLTDNVIEITMHQTALDTQMMALPKQYRTEPYKHARELQAALGRSFRAKVEFTTVLGKMDEETAETVNIGHAFRNEVYHLGLQHEAVLPVMSRFYFEVACGFLADYAPPFFGFSSRTHLPPRAKSYLGAKPHFSADAYRAACTSLGAQARVDPSDFAVGLADHLDEVIANQDMAIETIADFQTIAREEAVVDTMVWSVAFSEDIKETARRTGWRGGSVADYVRWVREHCIKLPAAKDPVIGWRKRAQSVREERNRHTALRKYRNFMDQTAKMRSVLDEAHAQVEREIDSQFQQWKEDRAFGD